MSGWDDEEPPGTGLSHEAAESMGNEPPPHEFFGCPYRGHCAWSDLCHIRGCYMPKHAHRERSK